MQNTKSTWMRQIAAALFCLAGLSQAQATEIFYLHADHLNTPRLITDTQNQPVWQNTPLSEPFGTSAPDEDPGSTGTPFTFNLRFPGQYYDQETGTHYNYYRDHYFPGLGRYGQSDPIGLAGGINTYAYVSGNPISLIDLLGWLGFSQEECERILEEIEREWGTIEQIERLMEDIKPGAPLPKGKDYGLQKDGDPYGYRGQLFKSSSETYRNAVNELETDYIFAGIGMIKNAWGGLNVFLRGEDFVSGQDRVIWGTEILRVYYVIREMEKTYEEKCNGCEN
ncbi:MAG: hypothetical protein LBL72_03750 [Candidatus Accumulibacter sp.]|jgi:RHS repeat-associated protein|nr:hypothetical protein [Accumulibacter sp.]